MSEPEKVERCACEEAEVYRAALEGIATARCPWAGGPNGCTDDAPECDGCVARVALSRVERRP